MWKKIKPYVISVAIALGVGALSAILTRGNMTLPAIKPPLTPPEKAFPFVWSVLFILMGIGAALIYKDKYRDDSALGIYALQLVINFFWSIIFFNMRAYLFAFVWLVILWLFIIWMIVKFKRINSFAAYLQIPYLLWVTFAGYLTLAIYILNR